MSPRLLVLDALGGPRPHRFLPQLALLAELEIVYVPPPFSGEVASRTADLERWGPAVPVASPAQVCSAALEIAHCRPVDGVFSQSELLVEAVAGISSALGLPGNSPAAAQRLRHKGEQRRALHQHGIPCPPMRVLTGPDNVAAAAQAGSFPAVLKPVSGMGGSAVQRVDGPLQLSAAYERAGAIFAADPRLGHLPVEFILEELIPGEGWHTDPRFGDQVSVESLVVDGVPVHLAVTDKLPLAPPFREIGDILPSSLDADAQAAILAAASAAIRAIGVGTGATHTEIKLTGDGPRIIEVNGRLGGPVADLLTTAYGFDVIPQLGRMALGGTPDLPVGPPRAYAGYITPHPPPRPVQVGSCDGEERARALDGVLELLVDQRRGDRPRWQLGERGRLFRAWVEAPTAPGVLDLFARLQETLDFRLEPVVDHE